MAGSGLEDDPARHLGHRAGTFGLRLDPIPTMAHGDRYTSLVFPPTRGSLRWNPSGSWMR